MLKEVVFEIQHIIKKLFEAIVMLNVQKNINILIFNENNFHVSSYFVFLKKFLEKTNGFSSPDGSKYPFL